MAGSILIVDDIPSNVKLLEAKLGAEYFDVVGAGSGAEALEILESSSPDVILLDVMMPGMDGYEVCRRIKSNPDIEHIPVVMVTALSESDARIRGLESGADDFLTKPIDDMALFARVKSLVRLKRTIDEWQVREKTCDQFGVGSGPWSGSLANLKGAAILLVEENVAAAERLGEIFTGDGAEVERVATAKQALESITKRRFDLIMVGRISDDEALRLCSRLRSRKESRDAAIIVAFGDGAREEIAKGLDLGINDYVVLPVDGNELLARSRTQVRRKYYQDRLKGNFERSLAAALTDSLTGLYNRRYLTTHLGTLEQDRARHHQIGLLSVDIDMFKAINDHYGHAIGDFVLKEVAHRLSTGLRGFDMVARVGGEEFVVVMPDTNLHSVEVVGERLRKRIANTPIELQVPGGGLGVTVSIGGALSARNVELSETLRQSDEALYEAKRRGRNQVVISGAAAIKKARAS